jgi:5-methylcytosine-specific restriction endonuclease McrBC GTP-binding regulatory subunit McrB
MQEYLIENVADEIIKEKLKDGIFIPGNLTILATMNSSDQNVFTLDTAFKRRWEFEQISNDIISDTTHKYKNWYVPGTKVTWQTFLVKINDEILNNKIQTQTNEDKRLGKYFVGKECLTENVMSTAEEEAQEKAKRFAYKVLEYIWNDVCKIGREDWFDTENYKSLEDLIVAFISAENPLDVFQSITFEE